MLKRVEILVEDSLLQQVIGKYHLADAREAVFLALKALLDETDQPEHEPKDDEYDEFSDLSAWRLQPHHDTG
ncbi:type II toxin-antitoxin system VapB family antitoxin [Mycobacterium vicinigordonae]|uniref:Type II toxin-antitoxin system VapB family antitoxin n=1 Tax=Mycobacterium vicinigordonae TaxID=1719132 RepID=A0A7D6E9X6_9MYCO|nr:type II toxin-antitoxin system VapB family antitoxin [Mycobacterium vicinigordonae]QLL08285.1 type II toxin-antitoxin system VapB family antitoxin [Mycobacterium vicinigordonae]